MKRNILKLFLSIIFLLCLFDMPYGYYQLVRFLDFVGFAYLAYDANKVYKNNEVIIFIALAVLFQPFIKIALGRTLWNIVDVIVGIGLILSVMPKKVR